MDHHEKKPTEIDADGDLSNATEQGSSLVRELHASTSPVVVPFPSGRPPKKVAKRRACDPEIQAAIAAIDARAREIRTKPPELLSDRVPADVSLKREIGR